MQSYKDQVEIQLLGRKRLNYRATDKCAEVRRVIAVDLEWDRWSIPGVELLSIYTPCQSDYRT